MFLDRETIKVILPVGDLKGHLVRVPGGPHQVQSFPAAPPPPPPTSLFQGRTADLTFSQMLTVSFYTFLRQ